MNVEELAYLLGEEVEVGWSQSMKDFYADIPHVEILNDNHTILTSTTGRGQTPEEAIIDYGRELAGKTIKYRAYHPDAFILQIPETMEGV